MACHVVKMRIHSAKNSISIYIIIIGTTRPLPSSKCSVVYVIISESPEARLVSISIRAISMHKIESREISNWKYLSKTILACRERQANKVEIYFAVYITNDIEIITNATIKTQIYLFYMFQVLDSLVVDFNL